MNCRPGDLAIVVDSPEKYQHYIGAMLRVTQKHVEHTEGIANGLVYWCYESLSPSLPNRDGDSMCDYYIRPIRDNDGQDETLSWLDVPRYLADQEPEVLKEAERAMV